jgi:hypothetical protein
MTPIHSLMAMNCVLKGVRPRSPVGTGAEIASHEIAFDPKKTAPENEMVSSQNVSQNRDKTQIVPQT